MAVFESELHLGENISKERGSVVQYDGIATLKYRHLVIKIVTVSA